MSSDHASNSHPTPEQLPNDADPEFDSAIEEFVDSARRILERELGDRVQKLSDRLIALEQRLKAADEQIASLREQLRVGAVIRRGESMPVPADETGSAARASEPTRRAPEIPENPTLADVVRFLRQRGFTVQDNRSQGGSLWVLADAAAFEGARNDLAAAGIQSRYFPRGRALKPGPQYEIDPAKVLRT